MGVSVTSGEAEPGDKQRMWAATLSGECERGRTVVEPPPPPRRWPLHRVGRNLAGKLGLVVEWRMRVLEAPAWSLGVGGSTTSTMETSGGSPPLIG
jgi:hypothetical protein